MKTSMFVVLLLLLAGTFRIGAQEILFEDRFEGGVKPGWTWLRGNSASVRYNKGLEIRNEAAPEDQASNVLCRRADFLGRGSIRIETSVLQSTVPTRQYQQCGIFWRRSGAVVFKLVHELVDGKMYIFPGKVPVDSNNVRLRMTISGPDVVAEFCVEGEGTFRRVYEGRLDAQGTDEVCLQCNGGPADSEHWVLFHTFSVTRTDD
ncbi:MAG: hypothetical protein PHQ75_06775 [Thermoguttaceae bacterium]|nr:hypothetical protein [Thermoguttaceae bacterium]